MFATAVTVYFLYQAILVSVPAGWDWKWEKIGTYTELHNAESTGCQDIADFMNRYSLTRANPVLCIQAAGQ